ncbi:MAG: fibronectin type III domain-containing protein [Treponema sp.]|jgi:fibronectin type 3 domain-containing protein|nr:fibronectin type III domain-containing protein [Treponema sp.]
MKRNNKIAVVTLTFLLLVGFITGCQDATSPKQDLPAAPKELVSLARTETTISIKWASVNGATEYHVYVGTEANTLVLWGSTTETTYFIEGLSANTLYCIAVSAENKAGEGEKSDLINVTTTTNIPISKPPAPTGLVSITHTETSIAIAWNAVSGANKYHVYAGTVAGSLTLRGNPTSASFLIEGLTADTTYYIEVSAENEAGEGTKSAPITVTTNLGVKPAAPSGLAVGAITETSIAITWDSVPGASSYKVFAGTTTAEMTLQGSPTTTSFTITELSANTTCYVAVSTRTAANESDQSTPISVVTLPSAPTGLAAGTVTSNSIVVTWTGISGVSGYTVYAGTTSGNMTQRGTPTVASFAITGLTVNTTYYIAVSARNTSGEGDQSSPITATTKLPMPAGVIATPQAGSNSIQVSWNAVSGAASYNVYRSSSATGTYSNIGTTAGTSYNDTGPLVSKINS